MWPSFPPLYCYHFFIHRDVAALDWREANIRDAFKVARLISIVGRRCHGFIMKCGVNEMFTASCSIFVAVKCLLTIETCLVGCYT
ncbi:Uncharacterized protein APZ42_017903 [Daphnia magna]|uniref:Uncharacterized protein n=1 Tax=Daphnia magna TaxID=35525 RepID=A0A0P5YZC1_9CRUS|nr:Uncharacterized protein APZ42_017903 [Daphnia magna]